MTVLIVPTLHDLGAAQRHFGVPERRSDGIMMLFEAGELVVATACEPTPATAFAGVRWADRRHPGRPVTILSAARHAPAWNPPGRRIEVADAIDLEPLRPLVRILPRTSAPLSPPPALPPLPAPPGPGPRAGSLAGGLGIPALADLLFERHGIGLFDRMASGAMEAAKDTATPLRLLLTIKGPIDPQTPRAPGDRLEPGDFEGVEIEMKERMME